MSKAIVINFPAEGHINPTIGVVKELVNRGEEVIYYCEEEYRFKLQNVDVEFRNYGGMLEEINLKNRMKDMFNPLQMVYRFLRTTERAIPFLLESINREKFDYMIYDQHFILGRILAETLTIPTVASCTTFAMTKEILEDMKEKIKEIDVNSTLYKECNTIMNRISDRYNVNIHSLEELFHYESDMTLVFTSKYFQPHSDSFNNHVKFIGPSIISRNEEMKFPLYKLEGKSVIYISMGTELNEQLELYKKCVQAFKDFNGIVVISVGKEINLMEFSNTPSHFIIRPYVPQLEILKYADVFITHGGMNSVSEGLYHNTPLVILPITNDQPFVAKRVEELNAGIVLNHKSVTVAELKEAVNTLLNNSSYKEASTLIGQSLRESGGYKRAVDEIFNLKNKTYIIK
ncbi:glycosyl transferase [Bacillus thuringiensis serovar brasilensis]|uniref:macrolide family glycosyltransferase n=1 Tax=Bacillus cereus group TaxID=86661 RepID=UPI000A39AEE6|nr:macrolide family glycosyltransferase [Bacillus thuringiensis]MCU5031413.1 glycosyl transferase [Bacillus cereus]MRA74151.1 glycosyl transferase [Bacillus thuringiensis]MRA92739.1 glycosyl transferase [Bacillus thuringiensis]MRC55315.1 glycosyl transferase [Bacillus thuringiensis]OTX35203.1 glycosyl transferase [Bacillus thuringiensis serovar brasilensis]